MRILIVVTAITVGAVAAGAMVYASTEHAALTPALAVVGDDVYVAFARIDRSLKAGRVVMTSKEGGQATIAGGTAVSWRTNEALGLAAVGDTIYLGYVDYRSGKITVANFKGGDKLKSLSSRATGYSSRGGVSLAADSERLYVCFTGEKEDYVKVATFSGAAGGKIASENLRDLNECNTVLGASAVVTEQTLVVAWVNAEKKIVLTTYGVEKSSKGISFKYLKETRTEIKIRQDPMDKPALAASGKEIYLGYVDKNDKTVHVKFYTLEADGSLKSGGEARVSERPQDPVALAPLSGGKVLVAFLDENRALFFADK